MIITLCSSMKFVEEMKHVKDKLETKGHKVFTPILFDYHIIRDKLGDEKSFNKKKDELTKRHFKLIEQSDAIVVLNYDKVSSEGKNISNYIGGNTFAEICVAKYLEKQIFLMKPIPEGLPYSEELRAWGIKVLKDLNI